MHTYSFYNEDGCFTIYNLPQRGKWDYFYSKKFSTVMDDLLASKLDIKRNKKTQPRVMKKSQKRLSNRVQR